MRFNLQSTSTLAKSDPMASGVPASPAAQVSTNVSCISLLSVAGFTSVAVAM